jgi:hypothetical protein
VNDCRLKYVYMSLHGGTPKVHQSRWCAPTLVAQALKAVESAAGASRI